MGQRLQTTGFANLNRNSSAPLYSQAKEAIADYIDRAGLQPGDLLPSERELSEELEISRLTVRKALDSLIREGRIVRQPGKGTFVSQPKLEQRLLVLTSFTQAIQQEGHTPGTQVLKVEALPGSTAVCTQLRLPAGAPVIKVSRLRLVDGLPFSLATSHLRQDLAGLLTAQDLQTQSLYAVLREKCGLELAKTSAAVEATVAEPYEAALLQIDVGAPLFRMTGTLHTRAGEVVEYFHVLYRGDRLRFVTESS